MENDSDFDERLVESPLLKELGIKPAFIDGKDPPVDRERIRKYLRRELSGDEAASVETHLARYRTWFKAFGEALKEEE